MSESGKRHPLERHTRLERGKPLRASPEGTRQWVNRSRKKLPPKSQRRVEETPERQALVDELLTERRQCEASIPWVCTGRSTEVNEIIRRSQWAGGYLVKQNCEALCHNCHAFITAHPGPKGWAARHGHQIMGADRFVAGVVAIARRIRETTVGKCDADCTLDHREER